MRLDALCFNAADPARLEEFWTGLLKGAPTTFPLRFRHTDRPKVAQNRNHFNLSSESLDDQRQTVERALALGARHTDVGQMPEELHVVLADPEGNVFCVVDPGNNWLAGCGRLGDLAGDGLREVGVFWAEALGWPLIWDKDGETAIQSPAGGTKLTWGGPPLMARHPSDLLITFEVAGDEDHLISLGATRLRDEKDYVVLADPAGDEFRVVQP